MSRAPFSPAAFRRITRPLIRRDRSFDRRAITAEAQRRFRLGRMSGAPISWSKAMRGAWEMARNQIALAQSAEAELRASLPLAA